MIKILSKIALVALVGGLATPVFAQNAQQKNDIQQTFRQYARTYAAFQSDPNADTASRAEGRFNALTRLCRQSGYPQLTACFNDAVPNRLRFEGDVSPDFSFVAQVAPQAPVTELAPVEVAPAPQPEPEIVTQIVEAPLVVEPQPQIIEQPQVVEQPQVLQQPTPTEQVEIVAEPNRDVSTNRADYRQSFNAYARAYANFQQSRTDGNAANARNAFNAILQLCAADRHASASECFDRRVPSRLRFSGDANPDFSVTPPPAPAIETPVEAPVLDSQKEEPTVSNAPIIVDETPAPPPPQNDAQAQSQAVQQEEIVSAGRERGQQLNEQQSNQNIRDQLNNRPRNAQVVEQNNTDFRVVLQFNNQLIIQNRDDDRLQFDAVDTYEERLPNGRTRTTVVRRDGSRVVTIYNRNGDIVQRSLFQPDGREHVLVFTPQNREEDLLQWRDPADDLPPLRLSIPLNEYVLDVANSNQNQVVQFLDQPPVEQIQRLYSVDEVKRSARIRDTVRRLEISDLTFESGSANLGSNELGSLERVALAMHQMLRDNPAELFLIEGHTDAVGSELYNLRLSDLRAEVVAVALTRLFGIPPENLATQGYGERYLKVRTPFDERANRRVTIKRITPLVSPLG